MADTPNWETILDRALSDVEADRSFPIVGATFYQYVKESAERAGHVFPPDRDQNFKAFLEDHLSAVWVVPRPRRDFWVFPPDGADLLAAAVKPAYIRKDLFIAFTHVSEEHSRWYDSDSDSVLNKPADADVSEPGIHEIPSPSAEQGLTLRREFIEDSVDGEAARRLEAALDDSKPFSSFSTAVRDSDLQTEWHVFRLERVLQRIREWCVERGIRWHPSWIETPKFQLDEDEGSPAEISGEVWESLMNGFSDLSEDELGRISVPLDIVLKIIGR